MQLSLQNDNTWRKIMKISIGQLAFILLLAAVSYARPSRGQELLEKSININIENKTLGRC